MAFDTPKRDPYSFEPHKFERSAGGKTFCTYCGLFSLRNDFTAWSIRMGCNHRDHPQYDSKRNQFTKLPF